MENPIVTYAATNLDEVALTRLDAAQGIDEHDVAALLAGAIS
jgi:hypothetical protein